MTKTKKWELVVAILLIGMIVSLFIGLFQKSIDAQAETTYFSAEQYTESEGILCLRLLYFNCKYIIAC